VNPPDANGEARPWSKGAVFHTAFGALGGAELLAAAQTRLLREANLDLEVVTFGFATIPWAELFGDAPVHLLPRRSWLDLVRSRGNGKWGPRVARALPTLRGFDTILAHSQPLAAILGHADLRSRRLYYCHEAPWRLYPEKVDYRLLGPLPEDPWLAPLRAAALAVRNQARGNGRIRAYDLRGMAHLEGIAANSCFARDALHAIYGPLDISVIPPIIRFPASVPSRQGLRRGGLRVLVQTRMGLLKNVETILRGFAHYASRAGGDAHLHLVGDGEDRARLQALVEPLGLTGRVTFHGALDPVQQAGRLALIGRECDVFSLLPLDESFGMVYPEAAAQGLLLIGPDHGGPVEILEGGELGACLPVFEPEALAEELARIEAMPDAEVDARRQRTDAACRQRYDPSVLSHRLQTWVVGKE
jgi:glycosyltransferase involved in cell wall biosynthesis